MTGQQEQYVGKFVIDVGPAERPEDRNLGGASRDGLADGQIGVGLILSRWKSAYIGYRAL